MKSIDLKPTLAFKLQIAVIVCSLVLVTISFSGCLVKSDKCPRFQFYFSTTGFQTGYIYLPFPYDPNDNTTLNIDYINHTNILSKSIVTTIFGPALNISFDGDFSSQYVKKLKDDDYQMVNKFPLSLITEPNSPSDYYKIWIYYNGTSNNSVITGGFGRYICDSQDQLDRKEDMRFTINLVNGWQNRPIGLSTSSP